MNLELLENYDESNIILPTDDTVPVVDKECEANLRGFIFLWS